MQTKETDGDKNRLILRHLHDSDSDVDFDKFLVEMISSQPNVSHKLNSVRNQVKLSRKTENTDFEEKFACEFDPGMTIYSKKKLHIQKVDYINASVI